MKEIFKKAKFIGAQGSNGYNNGQEYKIIIRQVPDASNIFVHRDSVGTGDKGLTEYSNLEKLLDNWTEIR